MMEFSDIAIKEVLKYNRPGEGLTLAFGDRWYQDLSSIITQEPSTILMYGCKVVHDSHVKTFEVRGLP